MKTAAQKDRTLAERITDIPASKRNVFPNMDEVDRVARTLRLAQMTLHRWAELECGTDAGHIEEVPEGSGLYTYKPDGSDQGVSWRIPNREKGALARVAEACKLAGLHYYHQTDPRGCALYVSAEPLDAQNYSSKGIPCL